MPSIDAPLPRLYIANGRNFHKVREQALSDVFCPYKEFPAEDSIMEYIHGEKGSAILIRQNLLTDNDQQTFCWFLWHELGHFCELKILPKTVQKSVGIEKELATVIPFEDICEIAGEGITSTEDYLGIEIYSDDI